MCDKCVTCSRHCKVLGIQLSQERPRPCLHCPLPWVGGWRTALAGPFLEALPPLGLTALPCGPLSQPNSALAGARYLGSTGIIVWDNLRIALSKIRASIFPLLLTSWASVSLVYRDHADTGAGLHCGR
jgi:hypothetical protein